MHLGQQVEQKTHAERRIRGSQPAQYLTIEQIRRYLEQVGEAESAQALQTQARGLLQKDNPDLSDPTGDPSPGTMAHYLLLNYTRETAREQGAPAEIVARLEDAIDALYDRHPEAIQAPLVTIDHAIRFGQDAREVRQFQHSLQAILGQPTLSLALREVIGLCSSRGTRLEPAIDSTLQALGACMRIPAHPDDKTLLEILVNDLYHLKALKTTLEECKALVYRFQPFLQAAH